MLIKNILKRSKNSEKNIIMIWGKHYFIAKLKTKIDVIPRSCFNAKQEVQTELDNLNNVNFNDKAMSKSMVIRYVKEHNLGSSPGSDGILAEHMRYAINDKIVDY